MSVKVYKIRGYMKYRTGELQKFTLEIPALKREHALEKLYSLLGSRHKLKRSHIKIQEVEEVDPSNAESDYVRDLVSLNMIVVK